VEAVSPPPSGAGARRDQTRRDFIMRADIEALGADIERSVDLLRRRL
jgi:hypothetical protein